MEPGTVYLVGAGPGGPELLTQRGAHLLAAADCVIYDRLVDPRILRLAAKGGELLDVGKLPGSEGRSQGAINELLVRKARQHRVVVRLKGGDPLLFGRGAEELGALAQAKIRFEIIPGVSSVQAAAAYAGIPLTDRRVSSRLTIVTGHEAAAKGGHATALGPPDGGRPAAPAGGGGTTACRPAAAAGSTPRAAAARSAPARARGTLAIVMGREQLPAIARDLRRRGWPGRTPIALVRWAGRPQQAVLVATLATVEPALARQPECGPPVVAIVGEVVAHRERFQWWVRPPLAGRRIVVTRAEGDASELLQRLEALGATCLEFPVIAITPCAMRPAAEQALAAQLATYDWVIFTSAHGVSALAALLARQGRDARAFGPAKVCAIGPKTAAALERIGIMPDLIPRAFSTAGLTAAFRRVPLAAARVLIPRSALSIGDAFARALRARAAVVSEAPLYETTRLPVSAATIRQRLGDEAMDLVTFTSASTVQQFFRVLERAGWEPRRVLNGTQVACIGPQTAAAAKQAGLAVHIMPRRSWTIEGLVEAIVAAAGGGGPPAAERRRR